MKIKRDDLEDGQVIALLEEHLEDMYATSPPECVHALDVQALKSPEICFFSAWQGNTLQGCVAIKTLCQQHIEIKSMRTARHARQSGVASQLLAHALQHAHSLGYQKVSLETGSQDYFIPARRLYEKFNFHYCGPFGDYQENIHSCFMTKLLDSLD
ncbi:GNAT family N-acetyltransferase [Thalassotalea sp. LPB0316]|uniref:GNAT family N-acetyltransferase n=1 Tax=Thalassotalea sp. LPB0316 TaxID=2769490 RepID=UPI0018696B7F|nr:GNAT family N-acetyltransferase [Thalassotalea sp. LPB0316]QOL27304.1 GNAT family N-acetyltransferase [Thalassotalea sp. LPB0316]